MPGVSEDNVHFALLLAEDQISLADRYHPTTGKALAGATRYFRVVGRPESGWKASIVRPLGRARIWWPRFRSFSGPCIKVR
jgi:hypothetical protein